MTITLGYSDFGAPQDGIGPFGSIYDQGLNLKWQDSLSHVDAIVLWGGSDISPSLYNEKAINSSGPPEPSVRDLYEWHLLREAHQRGLPIIGVCRGAQLACVFAGGKLIQHVSSHGLGEHSVVTNEGEILTTNSYHHQMMYPYEIAHEMLAWCEQPRSDIYMPTDTPHSKRFTEREIKEPEVLYLNDINALCVQGHPEWMQLNSPFNAWFFNQVMQYCHIKE